MLDKICWEFVGRPHTSCCPGYIRHGSEDNVHAGQQLLRVGRHGVMCSGKKVQATSGMVAKMMYMLDGSCWELVGVVILSIFHGSPWKKGPGCRRQDFTS
eukprot:TRINITY_DN12776_c0_g1_i1.p1 TRINITY_DN12776_c0_g1~~TRINITY_DN12776_c0_g1_i1.p1  ORF type:complete len:100 (+),score=11.38 TRINITY_DN12776_c0_g1_i1:25-324(+)